MNDRLTPAQLDLLRLLASGYTVRLEHEGYWTARNSHGGVAGRFQDRTARKLRALNLATLKSTEFGLTLVEKSGQ